MFTQTEVAAMGDADLEAAFAAVSAERERRSAAASKARKAALAKANRRDRRCPDCLVAIRRDGKRADGAQRYECPKCGRHFCDTSETSLSSSKLPMRKIEEIITLIMLDCPDWVIAWIADVDQKTAQFWRDRCLDASVKWSTESKLSGHVWIDEMRFAPTRAGGLIDGVWTTYVGKIAKDAYIEVAFDSNRSGFCKLYSDKLGMPTRDAVLSALKGRVAEGSKLTHDGAASHNLAVKELSLVDDWCKFVAGEPEYERKMKLMSNCCSYLRHGFESHNGIKFGKLEAYANFFMYRWVHVRSYGMKSAIAYMVARVAGTPKSHIFADSFKKSSMWS